MELNLNSIKGLFLLILAVSANFVGNLLGCKTQKLLTENMYAKHIVLIFLRCSRLSLNTNILRPSSQSFIISRNLLKSLEVS